MVTLPVSFEPSVQSSFSSKSFSEVLPSGRAKDRVENRIEDRAERHAEPSQLGQLIVLAGPSGVGKGTLLNQLLRRHPEVQVSVSATTRSPRAGEVDGQHYYFLSREQFHAMIEGGELLEWAEFAGNCYGTPKQPVERAIARGKQVILEIELMGARQVRRSFPEAKQIFVLPPSESALEARIRSRGQDSDEAIARRLNRAKVELAAASEFDVQIVNDSLESALAELELAVFGNRAAEDRAAEDRAAEDRAAENRATKS